MLQATSFCFSLGSQPGSSASLHPTWLGATHLIRLVYCPLLVLFVQIIGQPICGPEDHNYSPNTCEVLSGDGGMEGKMPHVCLLVDCYLMFMFKCVTTCFCPCNSSESATLTLDFICIFCHQLFHISSSSYWQ